MTSAKSTARRVSPQFSPVARSAAVGRQAPYPPRRGPESATQGAKLQPLAPSGRAVTCSARRAGSPRPAPRPSTRLRTCVGVVASARPTERVPDRPMTKRLAVAPRPRPRFAQIADRQSPLRPAGGKAGLQPPPKRGPLPLSAMAPRNFEHPRGGRNRRPSGSADRARPSRGGAQARSVPPPPRREARPRRLGSARATCVGPLPRRGPRGGRLRHSAGLRTANAGGARARPRLPRLRREVRPSSVLSAASVAAGIVPHRDRR